MNFAKFLKTFFCKTPPGDCFWHLENLTFKLLILNKFLHSISIVDTLYLMSWNVDFVFLWSIKLKKHKLPLMFSGLPFYSWVIIRTIFILKNLVRYLWTSKQQIALRMIFLKQNSLKPDIFFNPIFISCFSECVFFRVQVFQSTGFSGSSLFRAQYFQGPAYSGSRFFRIQVFLGPSPGFRSSPLKEVLHNISILKI